MYSQGESCPELVSFLHPMVHWAFVSSLHNCFNDSSIQLQPFCFVQVFVKKHNLFVIILVFQLFFMFWNHISVPINILLDTRLNFSALRNLKRKLSLQTPWHQLGQSGLCLQSGETWQYPQTGQVGCIHSLDKQDVSSTQTSGLYPQPG